MNTVKIIFQVAFYAFVLHVSSTGAFGSKHKADVKLVIIGAGASGYAAGCRLLENNFTDFVILEAQDRIGGRVHSVPFGKDKIDMGGQWIHGEVGNLVHEMASKYDLVYKSSGLLDNLTIYQSNGSKFGADVFTQLMDFLENVGKEDISNVTVSRGEYDSERFWIIFESFIKQANLTHSEAVGLLRFVELFDNMLEASPSWFQTSLHGTFENNAGEFRVVWKFGGYSTLFSLLSKKIPNPNNALKIDEKVKLGKEVTLVDWLGDGQVLVRCADGSEFNADRVLTTVSLSVLKATANSIFKPALSQIHQRAIEGLGMGTVDKIYLEFPYRWWDPGTGGFGLHWHQEDKDKVPEELKWTTEMLGFTSVDNFPLNLLCGWITGAGAEAMENLSEHKVKKIMVNLLNQFSGPNVKVPEVLSMRRSQWHSNPFTRGSYSYRSVTSDSMAVSPTHLAQSISNSAGRTVLQFAGEATNEHHYGTVHGAVESGFREADIILFDNSKNGERGQ